MKRRRNFTIYDEEEEKDEGRKRKGQRDEEGEGRKGPGKGRLGIEGGGRGEGEGEGGGEAGGRVRHCWCLSDWRRWESFVTPHLSPLVTLGMHYACSTYIRGVTTGSAIRGLTRENCKHKKIDADKAQMSCDFFVRVFLHFKEEDSVLVD